MQNSKRTLTQKISKFLRHTLKPITELIHRQMKTSRVTRAVVRVITKYNILHRIHATLLKFLLQIMTMISSHKMTVILATAPPSS